MCFKKHNQPEINYDSLPPHMKKSLELMEELLKNNEFEKGINKTWIQKLKRMTLFR